MIDVFRIIDPKDPDTIQVLRIAFEAGRKRGRDEIMGHSETYDWERTVPDFKEWYEQATKERQESK